jgi:hypothetical protein
VEKLGFWLMVVVVSIIGIYVFKIIASQSNIDGLKSFAEVI